MTAVAMIPVIVQELQVYATVMKFAMRSMTAVVILVIYVMLQVSVGIQL